MVDFILENDNVVVGTSDQEHIIDILENKKGSWKSTPLVGIGITGYLKKNINEQNILAEIRRELEADGVVITELSVQNGEYQIDGRYA